VTVRRNCDDPVTTVQRAVAATVMRQRRNQSIVQRRHNFVIFYEFVYYFCVFDLDCECKFSKHTHTCSTALFPGLPRWAGTGKAKPNWILLKQETVSGSGISWAICKSAPCSRQITTPAPHHSNSVKQYIIVIKEICCHLCKQNLLLFIQPRWQLRRTYFFNHYNVLF